MNFNKESTNYKEQVDRDIIPKSSSSYKDSGVDFDAVGKFRKAVVSELKYKGNRYKRAIGIGHYAGLVSFMGGYLAIHTDGVGTKTILATQLDYFEEIGNDLVGMNVNDIAAIGAEPIAMVDYIGSSSFDEEKGKTIGKSINKACEEAGISMVGGETASVPDLVNGIDISGSVVGFLQKGREITGDSIRSGDVLVGLRSNGFHSNGYSLIRRIYDGKREKLDEKINGIPLWKLLLKGTTIYSRKIQEAVENYEIHGMAHITGGGFRNISRLKKMLYQVSYKEIPEIFELVIKEGNVSKEEAFQTFNMGIGFVVVSPKSMVEDLMDFLKGFDPAILGEVTEGNGVKIEKYDIKYEGYY